MNEEPVCLLKRVEKQEKAAQDFGFYWDAFHQLMDQILSECKEIQQAWQASDSDHLQEEIGDLMHAAASLAIFCQFDPHETLHKSLQKFQKRFDLVVKFAQQDGLTTLHGQSFSQLMHYWNRAKAEAAQ